jgi:hypothetical protein
MSVRGDSCPGAVRHFRDANADMPLRRTESVPPTSTVTAAYAQICVVIAAF